MGKTVETNKLSFRRNICKDVADVTSSGTVFEILGPAAANGHEDTNTSMAWNSNSTHDKRRKYSHQQQGPLYYSTIATI